MCLKPTGFLLIHIPISPPVYVQERLWRVTHFRTGRAALHPLTQWAIFESSVALFTFSLYRKINRGAHHSVGLLLLLRHIHSLCLFIPWPSFRGRVCILGVWNENVRRQARDELESYTALGLSALFTLLQEGWIRRFSWHAQAHLGLVGYWFNCASLDVTDQVSVQACVCI